MKKLNKKDRYSQQLFEKDLVMLENKEINIEKNKVRIITLKNNKFFVIYLLLKDVCCSVDMFNLDLSKNSKNTPAS